MAQKRRYSIKATTLDKRGRIIAVGYNSYTKTHPLQAQWAQEASEDHKITLHAEIAAIIKSRKQSIHTIVIERYDRAGQPKSAAPCTVCQHAIKLAGIKWVRYTNG